MVLALDPSLTTRSSGKNDRHRGEEAELERLFKVIGKTYLLISIDFYVREKENDEVNGID
jgi:hypothetical protein